MLQANFKNLFLENILDFIWRQWSNLGIAGGAQSKECQIIDPEALLIFSLQMGRYEPRIFDEILGWLAVNGRSIDIQRLRGILKGQDEDTRRLVSAVAAFLSSQGPKPNQRKWKALGLLNRTDKNTPPGPLFKKKDGKPYLIIKSESAIFREYGFTREDFKLRRIAKPASVSVSSNIRFLLRALFGLGSRSECILYLLTHKAGHPSQVAEAIGISVKGTQDALVELAESGLVLTRIKGKRKIEYWLSSKKWWEFLGNAPPSEIKLPAWVNWIAIFKALSGIWKVLEEIDTGDMSDYMKSSKLHEAMEVFVSKEFTKSGLDAPLPIPSKGVRIEEYAKRFEEFVAKVLGSGTVFS